MAQQKEGRPRIPRFRSEEEEAQFWETHSPLDYPEQWVETKGLKVARPLAHTLAVRLNAQTIGKLAAISRKKGIGPSTLARMWLLERLAGWEKAEQEKVEAE